MYIYNVVQLYTTEYKYFLTNFYFYLWTATHTGTTSMDACNISMMEGLHARFRLLFPTA